MSRPLLLVSFSLVVLYGLFVLYVHSEHEVDRANERRQNSYRLAEALQQSSDDLTRMVKGYVVTSDPRFKEYFQTILDIRRGKIRQPEGYSYIYWDLVLAHPLKLSPAFPC